VSVSRKIGISGFTSSPRKTAGGELYSGRFTCTDVQWTGEGDDLMATFTLTAEEVAAAAENQLVWTDQDVQRGIRPEVSTAPRELAVGDGYPSTDTYIFNADNADDIAEKLLRGDKLFLSPLVWNLRPGTFAAYWNHGASALYLYEGKIFLPDSHHRQQAILKAVRAYREAPSEYPKFSLSRQFKVELYFLSKQDEGNYFFDKNQRPQPTSKSKAYDLTTLDDLSLLAKRVIERSSALKDNVNRVTDRLTSKNPQVMTLSTLREMGKSISVDEMLDEPEIDGLATVAATFYDLLASIRPELGHMTQLDRKKIRHDLVVDAAVMMHGYATLIRDFNTSIGAKGVTAATEEWASKLQPFLPSASIPSTAGKVIYLRSEIRCGRKWA
jgi:DndB-like DNA-sulfur modification-associated protein